MPPTRSANTCHQCRVRKVRCQGGPGICSNCHRLKFDCSLASSTPTLSLDDTLTLAASREQRPEKRRQTRACLQCRASKSKCSGDRAGCTSCKERGRPCHYAPSKRIRYDQKQNKEARQGQKTGSPPPGERPSETMFEAASSSVRPITPQTNLTRPTPSATGSSPPHMSATADARTTEGSEMEDEVSLCLSHHAESAWNNSQRSSSRNPPQYRIEAENAQRHSRDGEVPPHHRQAPAERTGAVPPSQLIPNAISFPPVKEQLQLTGEFFRHMHPHPTSSFLNEVIVTRQCLAGTLDRTLSLAIFAITSKILKYSKYHPGHTTAWVQEAENTVWQTLERPTIYKTQALLLIVIYHIETGNFAKAYMLLSMVSRFASALRLQYERMDLGHLSQESRRRLMWCILMVDSYFAVGLPESETCGYTLRYLRLPCSEEEFHGDYTSTAGPAPAQDEAAVQGDRALSPINDKPAVPIGVSPLDGVLEGGLLRQYIQMCMIGKEVLQYTRAISNQPGNDESAELFIAKVESFSSQIDVARPDDYHIDRMQSFKRSKWLLRYTLTQMAWRQITCDLFRLFLRGYREAAPDSLIAACPTDYIRHAALRCLECARAIVQILGDFDDMRVDMIHLPSHMVICSYHACRLLLYLSRCNVLPSPQSLSPEAAHFISTCTLSVLKRLQSGSPLVHRSICDLEYILEMHAQGTPGEPLLGGSSDEGDKDQESGSTSRRPRFTRDVERHRSLGVHSVLRRARFTDQSPEPEALHPWTDTSTPRLADKVAYQQHSMDNSWLQPGTTWQPVRDPGSVCRTANAQHDVMEGGGPSQFASAGISADAAILLNLAQPQSGHVAMPPGPFNMGPSEFGPWGPYGAWQWPEDFDPGVEGGF